MPRIKNLVAIIACLAVVGGVSVPVSASVDQVGDDLVGEAVLDQFGRSMAMSADGTRIAIGTLPDDASASGYVRVFEWDSGTSTWDQLGDDIDGEAGGDQSGSSVAMSADGNRIAIGAQDNDNNGSDSGHVRVFDWDSDTATWNQAGSDIDGEAEGDESGHSIAMSADGNRIVIGSEDHDDLCGGGLDSGHARIFDWDSNTATWNRVGENIGGKAADDDFGWSVAISAEGTRVAIGAIQYGTESPASGYVSVFDVMEVSVASQGASTLIVQLGGDINGEAPDDHSGHSVVMSADGTRIAIGADENGGNGTDSGHVRIFDWDSNTSTWNQAGDDIDGEAADDLSGHSLAISADGNRIAIGARRNDGNGEDSGHVRIFDWDSNTSTWNQAGDDIDGEAEGDQSGESIAMSADGTRIAIGAEHNFGTDAMLLYSGHVRVFDWDSDTSNWNQAGDDIDGEAEGDEFGDAMAMSADGTRIAIGAGHNGGNGEDSGHVRVFDWDADTSTWNQAGDDIDGEAEGDESGHSIAMSADGNRIAIGADHNGANGAESGHVRVFDWDADTSTWNQVGSDIDGEAERDSSGHSVAMSADGTRIAIGADRNSNGCNPEVGHVRIYDWDGVTGDLDGIDLWTQVGNDVDGEGKNDDFGQSVAISNDGSRLVVGADNNDGNGSDAGHVRVFTFAYEPTAPTGLSGVAAFNAVELAWTVPTDDGLSSITGYSIQSSTNGGNWVTEIADTGSSATTATVTGLVGGTAYQFRVAAINEIGVGQYSPASNAVTLAVVAPPEAEPAEPANGSPTFTG